MCDFGNGGGVVISKTYTYEVIKDGVIMGSGIVKISFFTSAKDAYDSAEKELSKYGVYIVNFRRVK